jgi:tetratricopeptide (TPR) repeat protein
MYLPRRSRWSMNRRRKPINYFGWMIFALVVLFGYYFNRVYLPSSPVLAGPTPTATRSPESYVTEAQQLFTGGKLEDAINDYKAAISASPQNPEYYVALARVQVWAGQYTDAQSNAENALLLNANNAMAMAIRAWALNWQLGKNGEALTAIEQAVAIDDHNAIIQSYYVEILYDSGFDNLQKAISQSKVALALDDKIVESHRARGYLLARTDNLEESIREYDTAISINPNLAMLHTEQGQNYRLLNQEDKAIEQFLKAVTLSPKDPEPYYLISRTYATFGEYAKALQYADSAVQNSPDNPRYRANLGVMYYRNFQYADAVKELGLAVYGGTSDDGVKVTGIPLANDPRISEFYFTLGLALARTYQCGPALQLVQQLQTQGSSDDITKDATNKIITICQENLTNPPPDTSTPSSAEAESTATPTPEPELTVTPTP